MQISYILMKISRVIWNSTSLRGDQAANSSPWIIYISLNLDTHEQLEGSGINQIRREINNKFHFIPFFPIWQLVFLILVEILGRWIVRAVENDWKISLLACKSGTLDTSLRWEVWLTDLNKRRIAPTVIGLQSREDWYLSMNTIHAFVLHQLSYEATLDRVCSFPLKIGGYPRELCPFVYSVFLEIKNFSRLDQLYKLICVTNFEVLVSRISRISIWTTICQESADGNSTFPFGSDSMKKTFKSKYQISGTCNCRS